MIQDRNPLFVALRWRRAQRLRAQDTEQEPRVHTFRRGRGAAAVPALHRPASSTPMRRSVETDTVRAVKLYVTVPRAATGALTGGATPFNFVVEDLSDGNRTIAPPFRSANDNGLADTPSVDLKRPPCSSRLGFFAVSDVDFADLPRSVDVRRRRQRQRLSRRTPTTARIAQGDSGIGQVAGA